MLGSHEAGLEVGLLQVGGDAHVQLCGWWAGGTRRTTCCSACLGEERSWACAAQPVVADKPNLSLIMAGRATVWHDAAGGLMGLARHLPWWLCRKPGCAEAIGLQGEAAATFRA